MSPDAVGLMCVLTLLVATFTGGLFLVVLSNRIDRALRQFRKMMALLAQLLQGQAQTQSSLSHIKVMTLRKSRTQHTSDDDEEDEDDPLLVDCALQFRLVERQLERRRSQPFDDTPPEVASVALLEWHLRKCWDEFQMRARERSKDPDVELPRILAQWQGLTDPCSSALMEEEEA